MAADNRVIRATQRARITQVQRSADNSSVAASPSASMADIEFAEDVRSRRQISHDIHHELGTIMLLARLLQEAEDIGTDSRRRASLIIGETRWLEQLFRAYDSAAAETDARQPGHLPAIAVHEVGIEVVDAMRMSTLTRVQISASPVYSRISRLALWRAMRNLIDNAVRAAGPDGNVDLRIWAESGVVFIEIDDDGPGFGQSAAGRSSLGLNIVQDFVANAGGHMEIRRGLRGGCCVRLEIPELLDQERMILEPGSSP